MPTEKIIMVDRIPEKLSDEEMKTIRDDYAVYCAETYRNVQNFDIPNKDAKDVVFQHLLSPFQYFIEDKVRLKRLSENRLEGGQQQQRAPSQAPAQERPKQQWKTRY